MGSDVTAPIAIQAMETHGLDRVFNPEKIVLVMDHFAPNKHIQAAANCATCPGLRAEARHQKLL